MQMVAENATIQEIQERRKTAVVNMNKLKGKLVERGMSVADLAQEMGIDKSTLYRKMRNNGKTLLVRDANQIIRILHLTMDEAVRIFFAENVA